MVGAAGWTCRAPLWLSAAHLNPVANWSWAQCNEKWDLTFSTAREGKSPKEERGKKKIEEEKKRRREKGKELQVVLINNSDKVFWEQYYSSNPSPDHQATLIMNVFCTHKKFSVQTLFAWQNGPTVIWPPWSIPERTKEEMDNFLSYSESYCVIKIALEIPLKNM